MFLVRWLSHRWGDTGAKAPSFSGSVISSTQLPPSLCFSASSHGKEKFIKDCAERVLCAKPIKSHFLGTHPNARLAGKCDLCGQEERENLASSVCHRESFDSHEATVPTCILGRLSGQHS